LGGGSGGGVGDDLVAFTAEEIELFGLRSELALEWVGLDPPGVATAGEVADGEAGELDLVAEGGGLSASSRRDC